MSKIPEAQPLILKDPNNQEEIPFTYLVHLLSKPPVRSSRRRQGPAAVRLWCDWEEYRRLTTRYFGLRPLITDRTEWTTAQILGAYRNLKDPAILATDPQFHWTDQKLHVHAFMCVMAYLLVRLLSWRARKANAFHGSLRNLLSELSQIGHCRLLDHTGRAGRPRVRQSTGRDGRDLARSGAAAQSFSIA